MQRPISRDCVAERSINWVPINCVLRDGMLFENRSSTVQSIHSSLASLMAHLCIAPFSIIVLSGNIIMPAPP